MKVTPATCARAREQVSLSLDGELSQLERRLLDAHLARCHACTSYADGVRAFTEALRAAPLEAPREPVVVRRPRRVSLGRVQVAAAAALAFLAVGIAGQLSASSDRPALSRFDGSPNLSPPGSVLEREQEILRVVRPGTTLPPPGSVL
jgi:anti-sigma factor RsiW